MLSGWVNSHRDHGGVIFIDLRDQYGLTQVTFDPNISKDAWKTAEKIRDEYVIRVSGKVVRRHPDLVNPKLATGEIEVMAETVEILNPSKTPPFEVAIIPSESEYDQEKDRTFTVNEDIRLRYRYLDLRRRKLLLNLTKRFQVIQYIRSFLAERGFLEITTPILTKSSPEGARDFLVPSRLHPGKFYALPQAPQQYKQLLMVGGIDKYFQIAPCFRDEDARADRSPGEFYQLDIEMAFVEREDVLRVVEEVLTAVVQKFTKKKILISPWPRIPYEEAILKYGIDKPDIRFGLDIVDVSDIVSRGGFSVFNDAIGDGGVVRAVNAKGGKRFSRKDIDELTRYVKQFGAGGLSFIVIDGKKSYRSPIVKFLGDAVVEEVIQKMKGEPGDIIFFGAGRKSVVCESLGNLRNELGRRLNLINDGTMGFCFIVDFPLFEPELVEGHYAPMHHMFTMPKEEDLNKLTPKEAGDAKSYQYDVVLNGNEIGGGSLRIHRRDIQEKIFQLIGFQEERVQFFSHMLQAFQYGAPPHGGIAIGIERLLMLLFGEKNIREVIAFPKNQKAQDLTIGAPAEVEPQQLEELKILVDQDHE